MNSSTILEKVALYGMTFLFLMSSLVKLVPSLFPAAVGADMDHKFELYSTVCFTTLFGYQPTPVTYKTVTGIIEFAGSLGLMSRDTRQLASVVLAVVMVGAVQTVICLQEIEFLFPAFTFLILCYIFKFTSRDILSEKAKVS